MKGVLKLFSFMLLGGVYMYLTGCAATQTALGHKDLEVQTRTSTAIFVDQVPRKKRTIYVSVRSGVMEFDRRSFKRFIKEQFAEGDEGYRVVDEPDKAQFQMNVYVLNLEKTNPTAAEEALNRGYVGSVAAGAVAGGLLNQSNPYGGAAVGGLLGGVAETISGSLVKDVTYMLVADVQIKEKARKGVIVRKDTKISAKVSDSGTSTQRVSEVGIRKEYQTRIVTTANKVNLDLADAQDLMFKKTAYAMAGFF
ncbi:MAG TPA: conjugal transfer protein TraT [Gammaproteobacteria bacterium]|nr:conjugal transfer protein TraT [Gammaproteobacteria bacterium]